MSNAQGFREFRRWQGESEISTGGCSKLEGIDDREFFANQLAHPMCRDMDGSCRHSQPCRDFFTRKLFVVVEEVSHPCVFGDTAFDSSKDEVANFLACHVVEPVQKVIACRKRDQFLNRFVFDRLPGAECLVAQPTFQNLDPDTLRDLSQPGPERIPPAMLLAHDSQVDRKQRFLGNVLGIGMISAPVAAPSIDQTAVYIGEHTPGLIPEAFVAQLGQ